MPLLIAVTSESGTLKNLPHKSSKSKMQELLQRSVQDTRNLPMATGRGQSQQADQVCTLEGSADPLGLHCIMCEMELVVACFHEANI